MRFPRVLLKQNSRFGGGTCRCSQNAAARNATFCGCRFVARAVLATFGGEVFLAFSSFTLSVSHLSSSVFICVKPESQLALWWAGLQVFTKCGGKGSHVLWVQSCCSRDARNFGRGSVFGVSPFHFICVPSAFISAYLCQWNGNANFSVCSS